MLFLIWMCNFLSSVDHGALPCITQEIKEKNHTNNVGLGALGSLVYVGVTVGCLNSSKMLS